MNDDKSYDKDYDPAHLLQKLNGRLEHTNLLLEDINKKLGSIANTQNSTSVTFRCIVGGVILIVVLLLMNHK